MSKRQGEFHLGDGDFMNLKTSQIVRLNENFTIYSEEGPVTIRVDISSDFANIPEKYHEICFNVLSSKYLNKVNFGDNPFSKCVPQPKKKWYQFWKASVNI